MVRGVLYVIWGPRFLFLAREGIFFFFFFFYKYICIRALREKRAHA